MSITRQLLAVLAGTVFAAISSVASAQEWREGEHYDVITPPVRLAPSAEVVIHEFFWYGCGHCYTFESMIGPWKAQLPEGIKLEYSPAIWNPTMELHAKAYYIAKTLDVEDPVHGKIFEAMHLKRSRLGNEEAVKTIFVANGVAPEDYDKASKAFGISSQVRQADARARAARITGTPSMMVAGKYLITTRQAGGQANMLKIAQYLAEQELAAQQAAGSDTGL